MGHSNIQKVLVFIVAYNAEKTIVSVLERIPKELAENYELSILVIDDCSTDDTWDVTKNYLDEGYWCSTSVLRNPVNQGYGGNQKIGYHYASRHDFDVVALLHGDGQYAPETLPTLLAPFKNSSPPDAVFGSRMLDRASAIKGGMPIYKFIGNWILTGLQNFLLDSDLSEFHTGYRIYSVAALKQLPYHLNTDDFHFDTEIIVQLFFSQASVMELPIPTHYGDEVCHVNGLKYAWNVTKASIVARMIHLGIFFDPKYLLTSSDNPNYVSKFSFNSTHSNAFEQVQNNSVVLDMGCADGYLSERLQKEKSCKVISVDYDEHKIVKDCEYQSCDLNKSLPDIDWNTLDYIVFLDVIEHLNNPEEFLDKLRIKLSENTKVKIIVSSGNVCFFITRFMMMLGQFNYGRRGILDITHTRLFTIGSLKRLLRYGGYTVEKKYYVPAPFPLALGLNKISRSLVYLNNVANYLLPGLFAYQSLYVIKPRPDIGWLLKQTINDSSK